MNLLKNSVVALCLVASSMAAHAAVVKIEESAFTPQAGLITFSEKSLGTTNPVYAPTDYGGVSGAPVVSFGGYFIGQSMGASGSCPTGAALTGCVVGNPSGPLRLDAGSPGTSIVNDGANPSSPVLSGTPIFNGPIAILFDVDLAAVGLEGGFFDAIGGTAITAYARDGSVLGLIANGQPGIEFLGLATDDGSAQIAGLLFSLVGSEPGGFGIDNLRFGTSGQVVLPPTDVPEPTSLALLGLALTGMAATRRKRRA